MSWTFPRGRNTKFMAWTDRTSSTNHQQAAQCIVQGCTACTSENIIIMVQGAAVVDVVGVVVSPTNNIN